MVGYDDDLLDVMESVVVVSCKFIYFKRARHALHRSRFTYKYIYIYN